MERLPRNDRATELRQLVRRLEARHPSTHGHSRRVAGHAAALAAELGLAEGMVAKIRTAALLHDVGKSEVPSEILDKPGPLNGEEYTTVQGHPEIGARMVEALGDPAVQQPAPEVDPGIVIDLTRKRVALGDDIAPLTYREFELLQHIVLREGTTVDRCEIIDALWHADADDRPNERTIDVHVRRLRAKLGDYAEIIRTVRGAGYRFDRHADVTVLASGPSPDRF